MTKVKVYIDFEAISFPFSKVAKMTDDFPYAYTLGIYVGKKFKHKTFIFNFQNYAVENIFDILKYQITHDVRSLLDKKDFVINEKTTQFIGWAPYLEKKILENIFKDVEVTAFNKGFDLSITRLTSEFKTEYFTELKRLVKANINPDFISKRHLLNDGALAALAGYLLYAQVHPQKEYFFEFNVKNLVEEVRAYSKDDVLKIAFLNDNPQIFNDRKNKALNLVQEKQSLIKKMHNNSRLINRLEGFDSRMTIEMVIKELEIGNDELEKNRKDIEDKFDNI